jgi:putative DNA primase/helicase
MEEIMDKEYTRQDFFDFLYSRTTKGNVEIRGKVPEEGIAGGSKFFPVGKAIDLDFTNDRDWYFGVGTRDDSGRGKKKNLVEIPAFWVDVDPIKEDEKGNIIEPMTLKILGERLNATKVPFPSIIVGSGGGFHLYWVLENPIPMNSTNLGETDFLKVFEAIQRGLAKRLGGDMICAEAAHVLRVPETMNQKRDKAVAVKMMPMRIYHSSKFKPYLDENIQREMEQKNAPGWYSELLSSGNKIPQGERNGMMTKISGYLSTTGMNPIDIKATLSSLNETLCSPPLSRDELKTITTMWESEKKSVEITDIPLITESELIAMELPDIRMLLYPWMTEKSITLVAGEKGAGKTWFALSLLYSITRRKSFWKWETMSSGNCLYVDGEMNIKSIQNRLKYLDRGDEKFKEIFILSNDWNRTRSDKIQMLNIAAGYWQKIIKEICLNKGIEIVVFDNVASLCAGIDENVKSEWDVVNQWLLDLRFAGISSILLHHMGKNKYSQRGTSAREDNINTAIHITKPEEYASENLCMFGLKFDKNRDVEKKEDATLIQAMLWQLLEDPETNKALWNISIPGISERRVDVLRYLVKGMTNSEIAGIMKVDPSRITQQIGKLKEGGYLDKSRKPTQRGQVLLEQS